MQRAVAGMNHMNWDDIRLFLVVAEQGSFRKAALKAKLGHSTLSRRIESLEQTVGSKLFTRQTRGLSLTSAGEDMLATAKRVDSEFDELQLRLFGRDTVPSGKINLTLPPLLVNYLLAEHLKTFTDAWPEISIEISSDLGLIDLSSKKADLAIRITNNPGEQLIGRKVGLFCEAAYATPSYLENFLNQQKRQHVWISPGDAYKFEAQLDAPYQTELAHQVKLLATDMEAQGRIAEQGVGFAMLPCLMAEANPALVRFSSIVKRSDIWLLAHQDTRGNQRMKLFRAFLIKLFDAYDARLTGTSASPEEGSFIDV